MMKFAQTLAVIIDYFQRLGCPPQARVAQRDGFDVAEGRTR